MSNEARLSVVATSRNDDHGGNLLVRMQLFIDGLAEQAARTQFPIELIVVEWNPPADRPSLSECLEWRSAATFQPRLIRVPREVHASFANSDRIPLFQMVAKNVGIRRAVSPFVLATNIDILLSDELFDLMVDGLVEPVMYRCDRRDVRANLDRVPPPTPAECRALPAIRQHGLHASTGVPRPPIRLSRPDIGRIASAARDRLVLPRLHTSGCGDFTLTSREVWSSIRGYPEWPIFSWHLDGLPLFQAFAAGVGMVNLEAPNMVIHLEHGEGSGWTPEGAAALWARLDARGIPYLSTADYRRHARAVVSAGRNARPFNDDGWGLATYDLTDALRAGVA